MADITTRRGALQMLAAAPIAAMSIAAASAKVLMMPVSFGSSTSCRGS